MQIAQSIATDIISSGMSVLGASVQRTNLDIMWLLTSNTAGYCEQRVQIRGSVPGPVPTRKRTGATGFQTKPAPQKSTFPAPIKYLSSDRITT